MNGFGFAQWASAYCIASSGCSRLGRSMAGGDRSSGRIGLSTPRKALRRLGTTMPPPALCLTSDARRGATWPIDTAQEKPWDRRVST
jgi:hypothetical protein